MLLAHRLGADERRWPAPEDRFASDLLLHERIADPWLRALTRSALDAPVPIVLGGHTLVGPGIRLALAVTMDGLRRISALDLDLVEGDAELEAAIRDEIAATGPMTFARFMELALYHPERGYYRNAAARPGRDGDFLTAPEAHPIFGQAIARLAIDVWSALGRPATFTIREHGAGSGALAAALVDGSGRPSQTSPRPFATGRWRSSRVASRSCGRASATSSNPTTRPRSRGS